MQGGSQCGGDGTSVLGLPKQLPAAMQFSDIPDQVDRSTGDLSYFGWGQAKVPPE